VTVVLRNPRAGIVAFEPAPGVGDPLEFHRKLPHYAPTPLVSAPSIAATFGVGRVLVKDESSRFGLPSFKLLGASWATFRALQRHTGLALDDWATIDELSRLVSFLRPFTLAAATDGNHGRAVAHMAGLLGFDARVFVPRGTARARIDAIAGEGAEVEVVDGDYDATITRSARETGERCLVVDDTSWPGYEEIPRWVIEGYGTIFREVSEQIDSRPDLVFAPIGVGALGAAAVSFYKKTPGTLVVGVEPESAACVLASIEAGRLVTVSTAQDSIMAGLNCGTPSSIALPTLDAGLDWCVAIEDDVAREAMRALAATGIISGETGAAALAGLMGVASSPPYRDAMGLNETSTVLLLSTEGATDPESYERIVGKRPA
jgi:diaminopropionate ammonia-lyase